MYIVCLDMEGVIVPEIWIAFSEKSGIPELSVTTRDEPDYDKLMRYRLKILCEHGCTIRDIQDTIAQIDPLPGAVEFMDKLRANGQAVVLSDTFTQFAMPLMAKFGYPTLFCNELVIGDDGMIDDFRMRIDHSKLSTVKALQSMGYKAIAVGDSYNDLEMIRRAEVGFLFRSTPAIQAANSDLKAYEDYDELYDAIVRVQEQGI